MSETPQINLYNIANTKFLETCSDTFDFIYADCMYKSFDFTWLYPSLRKLKTDGIFIVQTDYHTVAVYKTWLDQLCLNGEFTFVNWLIYMNNWGGTPRNRFAQKHDDILVYCKGKSWKWYPDRIQIPKTTAGTKFDKKGTGTKTPSSVFYDHVSFSTMSNERTRIDGVGFPMQKPEWLMERLLLPFTDEEDEVLDLFMGTGTLGVVAKRYNRNYTGIEHDKVTFDMAKERIDESSI